MICTKCNIREAESYHSKSKLCMECKVIPAHTKVHDIKTWTEEKKREFPEKYQEFLERNKKKILGYKILTKEKRRLLEIPTINFNHELGGRDWKRELVRARDNYTCRECGKKWKEGMRRFDIHHIDGDKNKTRKVDDYEKEQHNMITMCHKCHMGLEITKKAISNGRNGSK